MVSFFLWDAIHNRDKKVTNVTKMLFTSYTICCCCSCLVAKLCPTLCDPMNCNMPVFPVLYCLPWVDDTIQPSSVASFSSCPQSFPASRSFPESALHIRWPKYQSVRLPYYSLHYHYIHTIIKLSHCLHQLLSPTITTVPGFFPFSFLPFLPSFHYCRSHWASTKLCCIDVPHIFSSRVLNDRKADPWLFVSWLWQGLTKVGYWREIRG